MITVACVYWKGSFRGRERIYNETWVQKLKRMVSVKLAIPHRFVCLSNVTIPGVETIPLKHDWPGWWSKIELFRPGLFDGRVLYLDLDMVIVKELSEIVYFDSPFAIMGVKPEPMKERDGKVVFTKHNSSVMIWDANEDASLIYADFHPSMMEVFWGDQDYITYRVRCLDSLPREWIKKLRTLEFGVPDEEVKIVLCMFGRKGKNEAAIKKYKWVKELWI